VFQFTLAEETNSYFVASNDCEIISCAPFEPATDAQFHDLFLKKTSKTKHKRVFAYPIFVL